MFAIKEVESGQFAKHTGETVDNEGNYYIKYPWKLVNNVNLAQQYTTQEHANEIAFWNLDHYKQWKVVNVDTDEEFEIKKGKYFPI